MPDISRLVIEVDSKGVLKAEGDLKVFEKLLNKTGKTADGTADKLGALQLVTGKLPGPLKSVSSGLMGVVGPGTAAAGVFVELGEMAVRYVGEALDAFAKYETIKTNLEVVSSSAEEASKTFNELRSFAGGTPFDLGQISDAAVMLRQANIESKNLISTLESLGNVSGGSSERFGRIAMNYAQIAQLGKASSMDMKQFMMAGVPIQKMLEDIGKAGSTSFLL